MALDHGNGFSAYHENVFATVNSHIVVYQNTQNSNFSTHWHTPLEIIMPIENTYTAFVNSTEYILRPDDILLIAPNIYHSYVAPPTGSRYFYLIDLSVLKDVRDFNQITALINPVTLITPEEYPELHPMIKDLLLDIYNAYNERETLLVPDLSSSHAPASIIDLSETIIYTKLSKIFILIAKHVQKTTTRNTDIFAKNKQQEYLNRFTMVCNYIDIHCSEYLTLEQISKLANFSKYHFSRLFKEFTGEPFYRYVNRKRIEYACTLLQNQNLTITEIGLASGYSSNSVFIRMFKQFHGCTPKEYRNQYLKSKE